MVKHSGQSVRQLGLEEGSLDVLGEVVEHVHRLPGEGEVGPEYRTLSTHSGDNIKLDTNRHCLSSWLSCLALLVCCSWLCAPHLPGSPMSSCSSRVVTSSFFYFSFYLNIVNSL